MRRLLALCVALSALAGTTPAQPGTNTVSERPFDDRRVVSPSGRLYAVLTARRGYWPGPYELRRRREGAESLAAQRIDWLRDALRPSLGDSAASDPFARLADPSDALLARRILPQLPVAAWVFDQPPGLLLFDHHAALGYGQLLTFLDVEGREVWSVTLDDLFGGEPAGTWHTPNSRVWCDGYGVDPERAVAWVVSRDHAFRQIDLNTGRVARPDAEALLGFCTRGPDASRRAALDALLRRRDGVPAELAEPLARLAADAQRPLAECLRAAVAAHRAGSAFEPGSLFDEALRRGSAEEALFAASHRHLVEPGVDPLPGLRIALRRFEGAIDPRPFTWQFLSDPHRVADLRDALLALGEPARDELRKWADHGGEPLDFRIRAASLYWLLAGSGLPEGLRRAVAASADPTDAEAVFEALFRGEPDDLAAVLVDLLIAGSADDARIASWFVDHPDRAAVEGLERAAARLPADSDDLELIDAALQACRGASARSG